LPPAASVQVCSLELHLIFVVSSAVVAARLVFHLEFHPEPEINGWVPSPAAGGLA
jgi:hypothetical protein